MLRRHISFVGLLAFSLVQSGLAGPRTGPSSSQSPYLLPVGRVATVSVLTVGDSVNFKADGVTPYRLGGAPDGLGAFPNGDRTFTLLVNHGISGVQGIARDHGIRGSYISKWIINKDTLEVLHGEDLIKQAWRWSNNIQSYAPYITNFNPTGLNRMSSADLAPINAFYNSATKKGFNGYIYLNGEEAASEGKAYAHFMDGNSYELPHLGKMFWENAVAHPKAGDNTIVACTDNAAAGQVYIYIGEKAESSDPLVASGLFGGNLYGIKVDGFPTENALTGIPFNTTFSLVNLGNVSGKVGAQIEAESNLGLVTRFIRPEDSSWDPTHPNDLYFATSATFAGNSRLWRVRFFDINDPTLGGVIDMMLDGSEGHKTLDNITVSKRGSVFLNEDPGNNAHVAKVWRYSPTLDVIELVAEHDAARFVIGGANFLTQDEEATGMIPLDNVGLPSWYMIAVQAHYPNGPELVEGGQLLIVNFPANREL